ncbi:hypothetical protein TWF506_000279 [Arthrobotrys conoides]|uniref:Uncharacterized protein n=1 Tax=Arthrobotrys conoides TaxID=74498 RepID=A0AAN8PQK7_9PEZI
MAPKKAKSDKRRDQPPTDTAGATSSSSVRRGRGRPPGSRSRSRTGTSISPIRHRHTRATRIRIAPPNNSNSTSPSPTRRRGRPPGSRNRAYNENVRPQVYGEDQIGSPVPGPQPESLSNFNFSWPMPSDPGSLAEPPSDALSRQAIRRDSSPNVQQRVEQIFAEMHGNDVRRVSENLSRMVINGRRSQPNIVYVPQPNTLHPSLPPGVSPSRSSRRSRGPSNSAAIQEPHQEPQEIRLGGSRNPDVDHMDMSLDEPVIVPEDPDWLIVPRDPTNFPSSSTNADSPSTTLTEFDVMMDGDCSKCLDISAYICDHCSMTYSNAVGSQVLVYTTGYSRGLMCPICGGVWCCWCRREEGDDTAVHVFGA